MRAAALWGSLVIVGVWLLVTETGLIDKVFLPSPVAVIQELVRLLWGVEILGDTLATIGRTGIGFAIGAALGVVVGLLMGSYRRMYALMEFPVDFFRSIPATALFPLFIVVFGLGNQVKIFVAAWAAGMVVLINTIYGMRNVAAVRVMVARTKKASRWRTFARVMIPSAMPYIVAGCRIGLSLALVVEIVCEMFLGSHSGLGRRIFNATSVLEMEEAYAGVLLVGVLGYTLNKIVVIAEKKLVHWAGK